MVRAAFLLGLLVTETLATRVDEIRVGLLAPRTTCASLYTSQPTEDVAGKLTATAYLVLKCIFTHLFQVFRIGIFIADATKG